MPRTAICPTSQRRVLLSAALAAVFGVAFTTAGTAQESEVPGPRPGDPVAIIETDHGEIVLDLWEDVAPKTVENFKKLADEKFYDGTAFHRIIDGFMVQGGDPLTRDPQRQDEWGTGGPGYTIEAEFNERKHVRGVISMARTADPDSAGSQFFICLAAVPHLDGKYTAFGKLVSGDDVLEKIAKTEVEVGGADSAPSRPVERVNVRSIRVEPWKGESPNQGDGRQAASPS